MTEILAVRHAELRAAQKLRESQSKGALLQDDADSQGFDELLAELHNGLSFAINAGKSGKHSEAGVSGLMPSGVLVKPQILNGSYPDWKQSLSKVEEMSAAENTGKSKHVHHKSPTEQTGKKIISHVVDNKHSKCSSLCEKKPQNSVNETKYKPQTLGVASGSIKEECNCQSPGVTAGSAQTASLSLAELANQHRSRRAKVACLSESVTVANKSVDDMANVPSTTSSQFNQTALNSVNSLLKGSDSFVSSSDSFLASKSSKLSEASMPFVLGCSSSAGSLTELPTDRSQRTKVAAGMSLSQLALQHKHTKSSQSAVLPSNGYVNGHISSLSAISPHNGYVNGGKPLLSLLMKNVSLEDSTPHTAVEASVAEHPSKEHTSGLSLASCLKLKASDTSCTKLHGKEQKLAIENVGVSHALSLTGGQPCHSDEDMNVKDIPTDLILQASSVGFVLCCVTRKRKLDNSSSKFRNNLKYPKFKCSSQVGNRILFPESFCHKIQPFDFSTPSPDDMVKHKQKQAFRRPDKEFEL